MTRVIAMIGLSAVLVLGVFAAARAQPAKPAVAPVPPAGNAENGKRLYVAIACYACHGYVGQGGAGPRIGPRPISFQAFMSALRRPRDEMPPYTSKSITDAQVADIYAYVQTFPEPPQVESLPLLK